MLKDCLEDGLEYISLARTWRMEICTPQQHDARIRVGCVFDRREGTQKHEHVWKGAFEKFEKPGLRAGMPSGTDPVREMLGGREEEEEVPPVGCKQAQKGCFTAEPSVNGAKIFYVRGLSPKPGSPGSWQLAVSLTYAKLTFWREAVLGERPIWGCFGTRNCLTDAEGSQLSFFTNAGFEVVLLPRKTTPEMPEVQCSTC
ncbi:hypothetical protein BJ508DRAFT_416350 [Ascobolus immersus RN42]|uniref:Uncharacterized protein n=1 Tax=Ascobolus immersus RN42 TaxID=1160509 RepID=A0A3N4HY19_ASCIM|nr:hypothetical protein BJ508DRAFT_416350 [Ascobolus immersus RN42]